MELPHGICQLLRDSGMLLRLEGEAIFCGLELVRKLVTVLLVLLDITLQLTDIRGVCLLTSYVIINGLLRLIQLLLQAIDAILGLLDLLLTVLLGLGKLCLELHGLLLRLFDGLLQLGAFIRKGLLL